MSDRVGIGRGPGQKRKEIDIWMFIPYGDFLFLELRYTWPAFDLPLTTFCLT
jgi:hypothetical protein